MASKEPDVFQVFANCHQAVKLFLRLQTQWRISPGGGLTGLDYSGVHQVMDSLNLWPDDLLFQDIQNMEYSAIECDANTTKK